MTTITKEFTKEQLQQIIETDHVQCGDASELARIALASLEAEAIAVRARWKADGSGHGDWKYYNIAHRDALMADETRECELVYTAMPAPVAVPECFKRLLHHAYGMTMGHDWNKGTMAGHHRDKLCQAVDDCRAAMLQGAEPVTTAYKSPDDFICMLTGRAKYLREKGEIKSPELLERAAAALQRGSVNTTNIPNGWKLVPIDPTKDMLRAGQSVVGFWLNTVHCYSKMLAAAPAAPQQEVKK